jgi:hypothetical protein
MGLKEVVDDSKGVTMVEAIAAEGSNRIKTSSD